MMRVAGQDPAAEVQAGPVIIDRAKDRTRIVLQLRAITIERELPESGEVAIRDAVALLQSLDTASKFGKILSAHYETVFLEPFDAPFHELLDVMKSRYLQPTAMAKDATDVALVFDRHDGGILKHVQFGPMDDKQLREQVLRWPPDDLPSVFTFIAPFWQQAREMDFDSRVLQAFFQEADENETGVAERILQELAGC